MHHFLRACRRFFAAPDAALPSSALGTPFADHGRRFVAAQSLVRGVYVYLLYLAVSQLTSLDGLSNQPLIYPIWPVEWLGASGTHWPTGVRALFLFYLGSNCLVAALPGWRSLRIAACLGLLEYVALKNSYGKINHGFHLPLLVAMVLALLPAGWDRPAAQVGRAVRQGTLLVFWACQAAVLLTYTMSGLGKFGGALYQIALGQPHAFSPGGFGAHIALRLFQTESDSDLGAWIIHHPWLTWPMMPFAIYLELFSFWLAFRPALQRLWAATLILFHLGTFFTMAIIFPQSCLLLALLFFHSPFAPERFPGWKTLAFQLPLAGKVLKMLASSRSRLDRSSTQDS